MTRPDEPFPIVAIGASAGGIEALEGFFGGLPAGIGAAYVIVTHLSPERESLLHQIVGRYTEMPVHVATHGARVVAGNVYVLPANAVLGIADGCLEIEPAHGRSRKPIDVFFSALAIEREEYAAAVVLSGGDGDGSLGVKAIKERGGLTLAQTPDGHGPRHPDMPLSAIATGLIDFAVPADEMGRKLAEFARSLSIAAARTGPGDAVATADKDRTTRPRRRSMPSCETRSDMISAATRRRPSCAASSAGCR